MKRLVQLHEIEKCSFPKYGFGTTLGNLVHDEKAVKGKRAKKLAAKKLTKDWRRMSWSFS